METFSRDLIGGKEIEKTVLNIVKKTYPDAHTVDGYCKDWDIYIPSLKKGIEVKSDQYSQKSGNIVVEESFNGKQDCGHQGSPRHHGAGAQRGQGFGRGRLLRIIIA